MSKEKVENAELSQEELDFYEAQVNAVKAQYGTAVCADPVTGVLFTTTLTQDRASRVTSAALADAIGDPLLADLRLINPLIIELRQRIAFVSEPNDE